MLKCRSFSLSSVNAALLMDLGRVMQPLDRVRDLLNIDSLFDLALNEEVGSLNLSLFARVLIEEVVSFCIVVGAIELILLLDDATESDRCEPRL
jgi:hypothetical protein